MVKKTELKVRPLDRSNEATTLEMAEGLHGTWVRLGFNGLAQSKRMGVRLSRFGDGTCLNEDNFVPVADKVSPDAAPYIGRGPDNDSIVGWITLEEREALPEMMREAREERRKANRSATERYRKETVK